MIWVRVFSLIPMLIPLLYSIVQCRIYIDRLARRPARLLSRGRQATSSASYGCLIELAGPWQSVPGGLKAVGLHLHDSARAEGRPQPPSP